MSEMHQCLFDELIMFVLETISSEDYLNDNDIYRSPNNVNWAKFKKSVINQSVKPGIYPRKVGRSVHYYAVRQGIHKTVANGYPSIGGLPAKYSVGLDAQPDHSHGLCQTYALMYYLGEEDRLKKGRSNYFDNIIIGLRFLLDFINADYYNREREWKPQEILEEMTRLCKNHSDQEVLENLKKINSHKISLTDLIKTLLKKKYINNLYTWYDFF